jgi:alpha-ketoglutarate-dependent taurine dioxygenase
MQIQDKKRQDISNFAEVKVLNEEHGFPLLVEKVEGQTSNTGSEMLTDLYVNHQDWLETLLCHYGAILFRNFEVSDQAKFESIMARFKHRLADYVGGNSPRTKVAANVYTSTEYPADCFLPMHNELSYTASWPRKLFFCCIVQPGEGGQTPLLDSRVLLQDLPYALVEEFRRKGIRYVRNLHGGVGFGKSWQDTFETSQRADVERYAQASGVELHWKEDGSVHLTHVRPATAIHPSTGEEVWFNQADQFHPSTILAQQSNGAAVYETMMTLYRGREDELPQNATFGDGSEIPLEFLETVRRAADRHKVLFDWRRGDLLMVDNMLAAHGRMPFAGPRRILVSMTAN